MTNTNNLEYFYSKLTEALNNNNLKTLLLSKHRGEDKSLRRISIRPVTLQGNPQLSFVYEHQTNHITKNHDYRASVELIQSLLGSDFKSAHLSLLDSGIQVDISKKGKINISLHNSKAAADTKHNRDHNREKYRFVDVSRSFLIQLGVTDKQHNVIPAMSRKWKQINKFVEVFSQALNVSPIDKEKPVKVVDFGSGKGYLTFAVHDYLSHSMGNKAQVTGVELRQNLADLCNKAALDHQGLEFVCGDVKTHAPKQTDVMIALHACDVATDYAINYGIQAEAGIIMCSPCCHKQIRPQMQSPELFQPMLQYGVHMGQQAEMVTDSLRALFLEANGYTTKVFEFISLEHTNKNKMILAVKNAKPDEQHKTEVLKQIAEIKTYYGIKEHCLESLLNEA